jgi:hypothetical protein
VLKLLLFCCASLLALTHALKGINEESEEDNSFRKHNGFPEDGLELGCIVDFN